MPVVIKIKGNEMTAFIKGEVDHHTVPSVRDKIDDALLVNEQIKNVVIDFDGVTFMDSSGVGLVMGRYRIVSKKGQSLSVRNLSERDYKIMKMSGIEKLAKISKKDETKRFGDIV